MRMRAAFLLSVTLGLSACAERPQLVMINPHTGIQVGCPVPDTLAGSGEFLISRACLSACSAAPSPNSAAAPRLAPIHALAGDLGGNEQDPAPAARRQPGGGELQSQQKAQTSGVEVHARHPATGGDLAQFPLDERGRTRDGLLDGGAGVDEQIHLRKFQAGGFQNPAHRRRAHRGVRVSARLDEMATADACFLLHPTPPTVRDVHPIRPPSRPG